MRQANARLKGRDDEVTLANLHEVASARLEGWAAWVASRNTFDEDDDSADDAKEVCDALHDSVAACNVIPTCLTHFEHSTSPKHANSTHNH